MNKNLIINKPDLDLIGDLMDYIRKYFDSFTVEHNNENNTIEFDIEVDINCIADKFAFDNIEPKYNLLVIQKDKQCENILNQAKELLK
jgi:hypothetical protein